MHNTNIICPVSYTHLDVYKRQHMLIAINWQQIPNGPPPHPARNKNNAGFPEAYNLIYSLGPVPRIVFTMSKTINAISS